MIGLKLLAKTCCMSDFMLMLKWKQNKKKNIFSKSSKFKVQIMIDLETVICESGCMCVCVKFYFRFFEFN